MEWLKIIGTMCSRCYNPKVIPSHSPDSYPAELILKMKNKPCNKHNNQHVRRRIVNSE